MDTHKVFDWVDADAVPGGANAIPCKWVLSCKHDENAKPVNFKARLVAKGFTQRPGVDFDETSLLMCSKETIRALSSNAARTNAEIKHWDVKMVFLTAPLEEMVFMKPPPGFPHLSGKIAHLQKAIYGLKQSGRCWYFTLRKALGELGFTPCKSDECLFLKKLTHGTEFLAMHVDDMLVVCPTPAAAEQLQKELEMKYILNDFGNVCFFLGMKVSRDRTTRTITLLQLGYIAQLLEKFSMSDCIPINTPCSNSLYLSCGLPMSNGEAKLMDHTLHRELVGGITWLMTCT